MPWVTWRQFISTQQAILVVQTPKNKVQETDQAAVIATDCSTSSINSESVGVELTRIDGPVRLGLGRVAPGTRVVELVRLGRVAGRVYQAVVVRLQNAKINDQFFFKHVWMRRPSLQDCINFGANCVFSVSDICALF